MSESYTASFHSGGMEKAGIDSSGRKRKSYCTDLGEYVEKRMRGSILSQIKEVREIKEEIPKVQERKQELNKTKFRTRHEIDWWN